MKIKSKKKTSKKVVKEESESVVKKENTDSSNNNAKTLLREIINHNIFFDKLVDQLGLGNPVLDKEDDDGYGDDDVYVIEENVKKFKKGQNEENRDTKRARLKQQNQLDLNNKHTSEDNEELLDAKDDADEEEKLAMDVEEVEHKEGSNEKTSIALSAQELRVKFQKKLESVSNYNPKTSQTVDSKKYKRNEEKKRKKEKQQKKQMAEKNKKSTPNKDENNKKAKIPSAADDLATIDFGKIEGIDQNKYYHEDNKSLAFADGGKKHLIHKLRDAEKKKEQIHKLQSSTETSQKDKAKEMQWNDTLKVASGEMRNNNDPMKLKKKIKQKLKKKEQSAKAWKARLEHQENAKMNRQKIRTHNLQQRKKGGSIGANLSKKRIAKDDNDDDDGKE